MLTLNETYADVISEHMAWLNRHGEPWRAKRFHEQLAAQPETAICEACLRGWLELQGHRVEPAEDQSTGGPDFRVGRKFYVECTCLTAEAATKASGLEPERTPGASNYRQMTHVFKNLCVGKAAQCGKADDLPCLLAICTLHFQAGAMCFNRRAVEMILTSQAMIASRFDPSVGEAVGDLYQTTDLRSSAFVRPGKGEDALVEVARQSIAGLLMCPFAQVDPQVVGVLHVEATNRFDRSHLSGTSFCQLAEGYQQGQFKVDWV